MPSILILTLTLSLGMAGCSRQKGGHDRQPGQAFLASRIPSGLAPQYYPPEGFVWDGYRADGLPEARYGVASPPVNPHAQVLILADADYPAEVYFELARQLLAAGYGVWILEPPGQGGAGHYLLQGKAIYAPNDHDAEAVAAGLIRDLIHPSPDKPLFVVGSGYSAITALSLSTLLKDRAYAGFVAFNPYLGGGIAPGTLWHRDQPLPGYWGGIAQSWQMENPDLRLRIKSDPWRKQMAGAYAGVTSLHLPVVALRQHGAPVRLFEPKTAVTSALNAASALCAHVPRCKLATSAGEQAFGGELTAFLDTQTSPAP
ncbi:alpha/beta hydrolase [Asticcacaulis sp. EMRT-3]|uniref:serine aminopeptidase domain-containing protein n=1 Tax=Asticcacaulis sp. EMRT-3 TaxID=3040349 RepID=UPI0024AED633|nr:alpha/beta hydrolase [Asticcacaulis sp. EMRT-3]MDI7774521.1 alpha/beta hydrolase [Asticcacaulis sp. EMRT-3]